jgi:hypothetical protein
MANEPQNPPSVNNVMSQAEESAVIKFEPVSPRSFNIHGVRQATTPASSMSPRPVNTALTLYSHDDVKDKDLGWDENAYRDQKRYEEKEKTAIRLYDKTQMLEAVQATLTHMRNDHLAPKGVYAPEFLDWVDDIGMSIIFF